VNAQWKKGGSGRRVLYGSFVGGKEQEKERGGEEG